MLIQAARLSNEMGPPQSGQEEQAIRERFATGAGILKVAKALGVGVSTVQRVKGAMATYVPPTTAESAPHP